MFKYEEPEVMANEKSLSLKITFNHVLRHLNTEADEQANIAMEI